MTLWKKALLSLALTTALWCVFAWPLPRYVAAGVPASSANIEKGHVRRMFQGDHLQIVYNYWLFADMLEGKTPWFRNVYEFNTGDDDARRYAGTADIPFNIVFALGYRLGGRAFGWNLTGLVTLWLTHLFTWLLLGRHVRDDRWAACIALLAVALPYRWGNLLGGSPGGFAMMLVPMMLWGVDAVIRRASIAGGIVAALSLLFASWNDSHVYFFTVLLFPCWCVLVLLDHEDMRWRSGRAWARLVVAGLPVALMAVAVVVAGRMSHAELSETAVSHGRTWHEVALYSPKPFGLTAWRAFGHESQIYVGWVLPAALAIGLLAQLAQVARRPRAAWRRAAFFALLLLGIALAVGLALGTRGPWGGALMGLVRDAVPPYRMIRQSAKIFTILPPLIAVAFGLAFGALPSAGRGARLARFAAGLLLAAALVDYAAQVRPTVCLLDDRQDAYRAVAEDARAANREPRAIVVPIWPGDSAWASLYEHYVSLYRIRMVNGYQPAVPKSYIEEIFQPFDSLNGGMLSDLQIEDLRRRGVDYLILHEDAFPEKVSYFPVAFTLKRFLNHPRLALLRQDRNVWAFKILDRPENREPAFPEWNVFFPVYYHEFEWSVPGERAADEASASSERFVPLRERGDALTVEAFEHIRAPEALLLVRCRGRGRANVDVLLDSGRVNRQKLAVGSKSWTWVEVPLGELGTSRRAEPTFRRQDGALDLDAMIFVSGRLPPAEPGSLFSLPPPLFFHAGYTDPARNGVRLRADYEPADAILYGPRLPLPEGRYELRVLHESPAPAGTPLGSVVVRVGDEPTESVTVVAGQSAVVPFSNVGRNFPVTLYFTFNRNADLEINSFVFERLE